MYLLLSKNNPFFEELNSNSNNRISSDFEGFNMSSEGKYRDREVLNTSTYKPDHNKNLYNSGSESDTFSDKSSGSADYLSRRESQESIVRNEKNVKRSVNKQKLPKESEKKKNKVERLKLYKNISGTLASILSILLVIIEQFEDDEFYIYNRENRIIGGLLMNCVRSLPNCTFKEAFEDTRVDLRLSLSYASKSLSGEIIPNNDPPYSVKELMKKKGIGIGDINNSDILSALNINEKTYGPLEGGYRKVKIILEESNKVNNIRMVITAISILAILMILIHRYIEYYLIIKIGSEDQYLSPPPQNTEQDTNTKITNKKQKRAFYKTSSFLYFIFFSSFHVLFPFPGMIKYVYLIQRNSVMIIPLSSLFNAIGSFKIFAVLKLLHIHSKYNTTEISKVLKNNNINISFFFTLKAYQKERPFMTLSLLFFLVCFSFGLTIRCFELPYWEAQNTIYQNWESRWNALWCLFISMTSISFGDFFPRTHAGRTFLVFAIVLGVFIVSCLMRNFTANCMLTESEHKSYKLLSRLREREKLQNHNSRIVLWSLKMAEGYSEYKKGNLTDLEFEYIIGKLKRNIDEEIIKQRGFSEKLKRLDKVQMKEQLIDICEDIERNIYEVENELKILQRMNEAFDGYKSTQELIQKFLKKSILNVQTMYQLFRSKPKSFGALGFENPAVYEKEKMKLKKYIDDIYTNYQEAYDGEDISPINNDKGNSIKFPSPKMGISVIQEHANQEEDIKSLHSNSNGNNNNNNGNNNSNNNISNSNSNNALKNRKYINGNALYLINVGDNKKKKDIFNWSLFFSSPYSQKPQSMYVPPQKSSSRRGRRSLKGDKMSSGGYSGGSIKENNKNIPEIFYSKELEKYKISNEDYREHFFSFFFDKKKKDEKKLVVLKNSPRILGTVKAMKEIRDRVQQILLQRNKYLLSENSEEEGE